jgi:RNA polymerase sigma-70 factor (ECF subfamily)
MVETQSDLPAAALSHLDGLYNLARWLVRDPVEAEDLVQEAYLHALRGAHQFQPGTNLRAWLFQILRNVFFTQSKRRKRGPVATDPATLNAIGAAACGDGGWDRASGSADGTLRADLAAALERLPEEYRSVVLLADIEEFTMGEVAAIVNCPVGTVKSRLFRARAMLRELLRDYVRETPARPRGDASGWLNQQDDRNQTHDVS